METLQILGWIYLGIMLGSIGGIIGLSFFQVHRVADLKATIGDLEEEKRLLKSKLTKSFNRGKPQPRKKRTWKRKPNKK